MMTVRLTNGRAVTISNKVARKLQRMGLILFVIKYDKEE
jgi:hypothetical protein